MRKFVATAAMALGALALHTPPAATLAAHATPPPVEQSADRATGDSGLASQRSGMVPSAPATARGAVAQAGVVAVLIWLTVIAGLIAMRCGRSHRWPRRRRRPISDQELRDLLGLPPVPLPA